MSFLSPSLRSLTHLQQESYVHISEGILTDGVSRQSSGKCCRNSSGWK